MEVVDVSNQVAMALLGTVFTKEELRDKEGNLRDGLPMDAFHHAHAAAQGFLAKQTRCWMQDDELLQRMKDLPAEKRKGIPLFTRDPAPAPAQTTTTVVVDTQEALKGRIRGLHSSGMSRKKIASLLNQEGVKGPRGGKWQTTSVCRIVRGVYSGEGTGVKSRQ